VRALGCEQLAAAGPRLSACTLKRVFLSEAKDLLSAGGEPATSTGR
jgi:hypothetical protein